MSEVAITLGAMELAMKLVDLLRARELARAEVVMAANGQAAAEARDRLERAHAAAVAVHEQLQRALASDEQRAMSNEPAVTVEAGTVLLWKTPHGNAGPAVVGEGR